MLTRALKHRLYGTGRSMSVSSLAKLFKHFSFDLRQWSETRVSLVFHLALLPIKITCYLNIWSCRATNKQKRESIATKIQAICWLKVF